MVLPDLKLKNPDVVEDYYTWTNLLQKMSGSKCHGCVKLEENIKLARELKRHKEEVNNLRYQMSDEALKQMPDFQGRVCGLFSLQNQKSLLASLLFYLT